MKKYLNLFLFLILVIVSFSLSTFAQENYKQLTKDNIKTLRSNDVVCPGLPIDHFSIISAPEAVYKAKHLRGNLVKNSHFVVEYIDFPEEAKVAFERAIEIWEYLIYSKVPIRVTAYWSSLGTNILGSANTSDFLINFEGAKKANTYYPIALAEKLAGKPLNSDNEDDIYCRFSSTIPWHYGEPDKIPAGKYDFTTIVLHEIGHGLGFISTMDVNEKIGSYGYNTPYKSIYDVYIENTSGDNFIDTSKFQNKSAKLYEALTNNAVFFEKEIEKVRPRLFAPTTFNGGSSISHLDDNTYPNGTTNALMTSTARTREVTHNPGPLALGIFYELGWKSTSISHKKPKNFVQGTPSVSIEAEILSDTTLVAGSAKLYYREGNGDWKTLNLTNVSGTNKYKTTIPIENSVTRIIYYFEVKDHFGETIVSPGKDGVNQTRYIYSFNIGPDNIGPIIYHTSLEIEEIDFINPFMTFVEDDFEEGIASVQVKYQVNGGAAKTIDLQKYDESIFGPEYSSGTDDEDLYMAIDAIQDLKLGDKIKYQIIAKDRAGNITTTPTEYTSTNKNAAPTLSFYEFTVTNLIAFKDAYKTDFENAENDFALLGFSISQENGFNSKGLHSSHPYKNGLGLLDPANGQGLVNRFERNEIAMLRYPINIAAGRNTEIAFDEVVLVEPGDDFDANLYDYVVVEASYDGLTWIPVEREYDSRSENRWDQLFSGSLSSGDYPNSTALGNIALTKRRVIRLDNNFINTFDGVPMLIRFRLYSDQLTNGWGWFIDNLYIQSESPIILANETESEVGLNIFPNPSTDYLDISLKLSEAQKVQIEIFSISGEKVYSEFVSTETEYLNHKVRVNALSSGNYILKVEEKKGFVYKRFNKI